MHFLDIWNFIKDECILKYKIIHHKKIEIILCCNRDYFSCHDQRDDSGLVDPNRIITHLGPLLLTWFNFKPSMDE